MLVKLTAGGIGIARQHLKKNLFFGVPHLATCIFLLFYNEPELGVGIDPAMALTPFRSIIGQGLNPRPSDREPSALPLDHGFCLARDNFAFENVLSFSSEIDEKKESKM